MKGDTEPVRLLGPACRSIAQIDYSRFAVLPLMSVYQNVVRFDLVWVFQKFGVLRRSVETNLLKKNPATEHRVIYRPLHTFSGWVPVSKNDVYPDHPPGLGQNQYTLYWATMVWLNVCELLINSAHSPTYAFYTKAKAVQEAIRPLITMFMNFYKTESLNEDGEMVHRFPTDDECKALIKKKYDELPIYGYWMMYPGKNINYTFTAEDFPEKFVSYEHFDAPAPADVVREECEKLDIVLPYGMQAEFEEARTELIKMYTPEQRAQLYKELPYFKWEDVQKDFVFDPRKHTILFTVLWRMNVCQRFALRCILEHSLLVDMSSGTAVSSDDPALDKEHARNVDPFCFKRIESIRMGTDSARKQGVTSLFAETVDQLMEFSRDLGVPFGPRATEGDITGTDALAAKNLVELIPTRWNDPIILTIKIVRAATVFDAWTSESRDVHTIIEEIKALGVYATTLFYRELAVRGINNALVSLERFVEAQSLGKSNQYLHRWRLFVKPEVREGLFFHLKLLSYSHIRLLAQMNLSLLHTDMDLCKTVEIDGYTATYYDLYYPSPHDATSSRTLPDHHEMLQNVPFFEELGCKALPIVEAYRGTFFPSTYVKSIVHTTPPPMTGQNAAYYAWLEQVRVVHETAATELFNTVATIEQVLRVHISSMLRPLRETCNHSFVFRHQTHHQLMGVLLLHLRNIPHLYASLVEYVGPQQLEMNNVDINDCAVRMASSDLRKNPESRPFFEKVLKAHLMQPKRKSRKDKLEDTTVVSMRQRTAIFVHNIDVSRAVTTGNRPAAEKKHRVPVIENVKFQDNYLALVEQYAMCHKNKDRLVRRKTQKQYVSSIVDIFVQRNKQPKAIRGVPINESEEKISVPLSYVYIHIPLPIRTEMNVRVRNMPQDTDFDVYELCTIADIPNQEYLKHQRSIYPNTFWDDDPFVEDNGDPIVRVAKPYQNMSRTTCAVLAHMEYKVRNRIPEKVCDKLFSMSMYDRYLYYLMCNLVMQQNWVKKVLIPDAVGNAQRRITQAKILQKRPDELVSFDGYGMLTRHAKRTNIGMALNSCGFKGVRNDYISGRYAFALKRNQILKRQRENEPDNPEVFSLMTNSVYMDSFKRVRGCGREEAHRHGSGAQAAPYIQKQIAERREQDEAVRKTQLKTVELIARGPPNMNMEQAPRPAVAIEKRESNDLFMFWVAERDALQAFKLEEIGESVDVLSPMPDPHIPSSVPATAPLSITHYNRIKKSDSIFCSPCCGHYVQCSSKVYAANWCGYCEDKVKMAALLPACNSCAKASTDPKPAFSVADLQTASYRDIWLCTTCSKGFAAWHDYSYIVTYEMFKAFTRNESYVHLIDDIGWTKAILKQFTFKTNIGMILNKEKGSTGVSAAGKVYKRTKTEIDEMTTFRNLMSKSVKRVKKESAPVDDEDIKTLSLPNKKKKKEGNMRIVKMGAASTRKKSKANKTEPTTNQENDAE